MTKKNSLSIYRKKRKFTETSEPKGKKSNTKNNSPIFVIQKHDSRNLHFDLRLEIDGVLKSWALPKGLTMDPNEKHLAIQTEDHPMKYADFEGIIPEGQYGAGKVIIWDKGTLENLKENKSLSDSLKDGELTFQLNGKTIKGGFALIKTKYRDKDTSWLLVKMKDKHAKTKKSK